MLVVMRDRGLVMQLCQRLRPSGRRITRQVAVGAIAYASKAVAVGLPRNETCRDSQSEQS